MHLFYKTNLKDGSHVLTDHEHHHLKQVLRCKVNDVVQVTDGNGLIATVVLKSIGRHQTEFEVRQEAVVPTKPFSTHLLVAPTKQIERMEWLVEKCAEVGVDRMSFIKCKRSERPTLKLDRLERKAISALKQSKGAYKLHLDPIAPLKVALEAVTENQKFIASVDPRSPYLSRMIGPGKSTAILIGPEGDFSPQEIEEVVARGFRQVSLGSRVLRTETAGIQAGIMVNFVNEF